MKRTGQDDEGAATDDGVQSTKDTFVLILHTHWEGAVFKTRELYLEMGLPVVLRALRPL